jgi:plasmid maintenance system antidote protein VapI
MLFKKVKKELINQDLKIKDLAVITGYTREHLSSVINGHHDSLKTKKSIALALKKDFKELWEREG